jgi:hypothetical protein
VRAAPAGRWAPWLGLDKDRRAKVARLITWQWFHDGDCIVKEGVKLAMGG